MLCPNDGDVHEVERILNKKTYKGQAYYQIKWVGYTDPTWELAKNCSCQGMIDEFNSARGSIPSTMARDEWEVEEILDKRIRKNRVEYRVKWKGWPGDPTWELSDNCTCYNLIAAYENPKLKKLWDFRNNNIKLWLTRQEILAYMQQYMKGLKMRVNLLVFEPDYPLNERPLDLQEGINIGPLCYENHWYLVIILIHHICITRRILVGDPLNTLIGTVIKEHPVVKRLRRTYSQYPIKPIRLTQMDRSDVCAYYVLAGFARAIFLLNPKAHFIIENLFFEPSKAESIRSSIRPDTNGEMSVALPIPDAYDHGPQCEFCLKLYETQKETDEHIIRRHMNKKKSNSVSSN